MKASKLAKKRTIVCFLLLILIIGGIVFFTTKNHESDNSSVASEQYTLNEILRLNNHPTAYGSFEDTEKFYSNIDAVKVLTVEKHSQIEKDLKKTTDDETLIYFIQNSANPEYIGTLQINLYDKSVSDGMSVDKAAELLISYLPNDFFEYYTKDVSYKYTGNGRTVYVCSYRLNDAGIVHRSDGYDRYSHYYAFKIFHFEDVNAWKLQTDFAAYGGKGLEWVQKYSDNWDYDFKDI